MPKTNSLLIGWDDKKIIKNWFYFISMNFWKVLAKLINVTKLQLKQLGKLKILLIAVKWFGYFSNKKPKHKKI